jgi:hypothetical protein
MAYQINKPTTAWSAPLVAIAGVFLALSSVGVVMVVPDMTAPTLPKVVRDESTGCWVGAPLTRSHIFALDLTDPFTDSYWRDLREKIHVARDEMPENGKLTIVMVDPKNPWKPIELFSRCSTGKPSGADTLTHTGSYDVREWENTFAKPIDAALAGLTRIPAAEPSPILETITALSWRGDFQKEVKERRLTLASDLVQHDPKGYSQLRSGSSWSRYAESRLYKNASPDLRGVQVEVLYVNRPAWLWLQNTQHVKFWQRTFKRFGAASVFIGAPSLEVGHVPVSKRKPKMATVPFLRAAE